MANEQNLRPATNEDRAKGRLNRIPIKARALKAIGKMQVVLLKAFNGSVEEEGPEGVILRGIKPSELASLATAWDKLEDRRWVIHGHGKPKPVRAVNEPSAETTKAPVAASEELPDTLPAKFG